MPELVTASDIKAYAGIEHSNDDSRIGNIAAYLSNLLKGKRNFFTTSEVEEVDGGGEFLFVSTWPIITINSIKDLGQSTDPEIDSSKYRIVGSGMIKRDGLNEKWKSGRFRFEVDYSGGYGNTQDDLPDDLVEDLAALGATLYNEPDVTIQSMSQGDESARRAGLLREKKRILREWTPRGYF